MRRFWIPLVVIGALMGFVVLAAMGGFAVWGGFSAWHWMSGTWT